MTAHEADSVPLEDAVRRILDGKNFACLATINPDGGPQSSFVWVGRDGDAIVLSVASHRQKALNLVRDPRVSVSIFELANPYHSVEIRGVAALIPDPDKSLSVRLSHKYLDEDPPPEPGVDRVIVRITPQKVIEFSA